MGRPNIAFLPAALALPFATAQHSLDPQRIAIAAEKALGAGTSEEAMLHVWRARDLLAHDTDYADRDAVLATLVGIEAKADSLLQARTEVDASVARRLTDLARAYRAKSWYASALLACDLALPFDPGAARQESSQLAKLQAKASQGKTKARSAIELLGNEDTIGEWRFADGALCSPAPQSTTASGMFLTKAHHDDDRLAVTIDTGNRDATAALCFGAHGFDDGYLAELETLAGSPKVGLILWRVTVGKPQRITGGEHTFSGPPSARRLEVLVRADQVECRVNGSTLVAASCPAAVRGSVGFFVSASSPCRDGIRFRDFEMTPLVAFPADAVAPPPEAQDLLRAEVTRGMAVADTLVQQKQPEQAAEQLRAVRSKASKLSAGTSLLSGIDKQLARLDNSLGLRTKSLVEAGQLLQALARRYAEAGWLGAASRMATAAATLDPDGQTAFAADLAARARAARAAMPKPPTNK